MGNKILSISIAGYNIEKYVSHTLESFIIPEIEDKLEVILVNDGSTDKTLKIAKEYEIKYPNLFTVIDKNNGGYGSTINASVSKAMGKYYKTVDGDDWVDKNGLIELIKYLENCEDDMVITNYARVNDKNGEIIPTIFDSKEYRKSMSFEEAYCGQELYMQAIAFKTELLRNIKLNITEKCFYTDIEYILKPIPYIKTVSFLNVMVYQYRIAVNEQSMSIAGRRKHIDEQKKIYYKMVELYNSQKNLTKEKDEFFVLILGAMTKSHILAILSLDVNFNNYKRLCEFDKFVSDSESIYKESSKYLPVKILRKTNYLTYSLESFAYKFHQKILY